VDYHDHLAGIRQVRRRTARPWEVVSLVTAVDRVYHRATARLPEWTAETPEEAHHG
jgi:hypothetical protein